MFAGFVLDQTHDDGRLFAEGFGVVFVFFAGEQLGNHLVRYLKGVAVVPSSAQVNLLPRIDTGNGAGTTGHQQNNQGNVNPSELHTSNWFTYLYAKIRPILSYNAFKRWIVSFGLAEENTKFPATNTSAPASINKGAF